MGQIIDIQNKLSSEPFGNDPEVEHALRAWNAGMLIKELLETPINNEESNEKS